jgi:hypothetical protein
MKKFFGARLLKLATFMGFEESTIKMSLLKSKNFKRNYRLLMEICEGFDHFFIRKSLEEKKYAPYQMGSAGA